MENGQDRAYRHPAVCNILGPLLLRSAHCLCWVGVIVECQSAGAKHTYSEDVEMCEVFWGF